MVWGVVVPDDVAGGRPLAGKVPPGLPVGDDVGWRGVAGGAVGEGHVVLGVVDVDVHVANLGFCGDFSVWCVYFFVNL